MTTIFETQFSLNNLCNTSSLPKMRVNLRDINHQSGGTTRSGTPDSKENEVNEFSPQGGLEIGVKPKKKHFATEAERSRFVENYKMKLKTELCKNFELRGWCKFGDNCSFAHGKHELQEKIHLHQKYKTKPCQQFHLHGHCNYGNRCQYLHSEAIMPNIFYQPTSDISNNVERMNYSYTLLQDVFKLANTDCKVEKLLKKIPKKPRLPVFEAISKSH